MLKLLWAAVCAFSIGQFAQAEPMSFKEQIQLSEYFADSFNKLPNDAGFSKLFLNLSKNDQQAMQKIVRGISPKKFGFEVTGRLNMVTLEKGGRLFMTLETVASSPTIILVNGVKRITLDPEDVYGSVTKQIGGGKEASALFNLLRAGFIPEAQAETYSTAEMSELKDVMLIYAGTTVNSGHSRISKDAPAKIGKGAPWKMIDSDEGRRFVTFVDWAISSMTGWPRRPDNRHFVCGKGSVSGNIQTWFDMSLPFLKFHKFKQDADGLLLDERVRIKLKRVDDKIAINGVELDIELCDKGVCKSSDLRSMLASEAKPSEKVESYRSVISNNNTTIAEIEEAFQKEHKLDARLKLNYNKNTETFDLDKIPAAEISGAKLQAYRDLLRPLYKSNREYEESIDGILTKNTKNKNDGEIAAARELFKAVAFTRAMQAGCRDNNFLAEAAGKGMTIEREGTPAAK